MQSVARCLQMMLRLDAYRIAFDQLDGIGTIAEILSARVGFQIQYQLSFCLWVLTFNPNIAERMNKYVNFNDVWNSFLFSTLTVCFIFRITLLCLLRNKVCYIIRFYSFRCGIIPILADILADAQKEKVSRIILAVFRVSIKSIFSFPCQ